MLQIQTEEDYTVIVEEFSDMIYRTAYQNLMNVADAEDVVQDVFMRLLKNKKGFADKEHLKAWLLRVAINRSRDYRRFALRRNETDLSEIEDAHTPQTGRLLEEIAELPRTDRIIVYLHYYEGYSIKEIAQIMGKNSNTVSSRLTRARKKLRSMLEVSGSP